MRDSPMEAMAERFFKIGEDFQGKCDIFNHFESKILTFSKKIKNW